MSDKLVITTPATPEEAEEILCDSLSKVGQEHPEFEIWIGSRKFSPLELLSEIKQRTEIGQNYLDGYFEGRKFFNI